MFFHSKKVQNPNFFAHFLVDQSASRFACQPWRDTLGIPWVPRNGTLNGRETVAAPRPVSGLLAGYSEMRRPVSEYPTLYQSTLCRQGLNRGTLHFNDKNIVCVCHSSNKTKYISDLCFSYRLYKFQNEAKFREDRHLVPYIRL